MGLFDWLRGRKKPDPLAAQSRLASRARGAPSSGAARDAAALAKLRGRPTPRPARTVIPSVRGYPAHIDAAFNGDELASFLLGLTVPCRSSWIDSARWDEDASNMTLTVDGKGYDFPGITYDEAQVFAHYPSKGIWFHQIYKGRLGTTSAVVKAYVVSEGLRGMRQPSRR